MGEHLSAGAACRRAAVVSVVYNLVRLRTLRAAAACGGTEDRGRRWRGADDEAPASTSGLVRGAFRSSRGEIFVIMAPSFAAC